MENENELELFKQLLIELIFENGFIPNLEYKVKNKVIREINGSLLAKDMNYQWIRYLGNSVDIFELIERYQDKYKFWKKQENEFENVKNEEDMVSFLETYFQKTYKVGYKLGEISKEEIKEMLKNKKPKISKGFKGSIYKYDNFLIFSNEQLHITIHIAVDSFREESFLFTAIISFWFDKPADPFSLDMNFVNENYYNLALAREIMNKLESSQYRKMNLFNFEKYDINNNQDSEFLNDWVKKYPQLFVSYGKQLLNANPMTLIEEITEDLQIFRSDDTLKAKLIQDPNIWFENLSQELRIFYNKGKELFLKSSQILEANQEDLKEYTKKEEFKGRKEKLAVDDFIFLFNKAMDIDLDKGDSFKDAGYRTFNQLFSDFLDKKTRNKKYDFIDPVSRGTFYNLVKLYKKDLETILEKNPEKGKGGGDAYRIIKIEKEISYEIDIPSDVYINELAKDLGEKIHEGFIYYKNKSHNQAIKIFEEVLTSKEIKKSKDYHLGTLFYLGKSYIKTKDYERAIPNFLKIIEIDENKIDAGFKLLVCYFNLKEYNLAKELSGKLYKRLLDFINPFSTLYRKEILFKEDLRFLEINPEELHPYVLNRDLFSKNLITFNKTIYFRDFYFLKPQFKGNWGIYERELDNYENLRYFLSVNIHNFRKLKLLQLEIFHYFIEINRRLIFSSLIIDEEESEALKQLNFILNFLNSELKNKNIKISRINDFLMFLVNISEIHFKTENNEISQLIRSKFPDLSEKIMGYKYLYVKYTQFIISYLTYITPAMKSKSFHWAVKQIKEEVGDPELIIESILLELLTVYQLSMDKIITETNNNLKSIKDVNSENIFYIYNSWKYELRFNINEGVSYVRDLFERYLEFSKIHRIRLMRNKLDSLQNSFEEKLKIINNLKEKGRNQVLNRIFKYFYPNYRVDIIHEKIDLSIKPKSFNYERMLHVDIFNKLWSWLHDQNSNYNVDILLFDKNLIDDLYVDLAEKIVFPSILEKDYKNKRIQISIRKSIRIAFSKMDFGKFLDAFVYDVIFNSFETKTDESFFNYIPDHKKYLADYFRNQFQKDFKNPYFDFIVKHFPERDIYSIKIVKKEVK